MRRCLRAYRIFLFWSLGALLLMVRVSLFAQAVNYADSVAITVNTGQDAIIVYDSTHAKQKIIGKIFKGEIVKAYRTKSSSDWRRVEYNGINGWISTSGTIKVDSAFSKILGGFKSNQVKLIVRADSLYLKLEPQKDQETAIVLLIKNNSIQSTDTLTFSKTQPEVSPNLNVTDGDTLVFSPANKNFLSFRTSLLELKAILQARPVQETVVVEYGIIESRFKKEKTISIEFQNIKSRELFPALKLVDSKNKFVDSKPDTAKGLVFSYKLDWMKEKSVEKFYIQLGTAAKEIKLNLTRQVKWTTVDIIAGSLALIIVTGIIIFPFRKKLKNKFFNNSTKLEKEFMLHIQYTVKRLEELIRSTDDVKLADPKTSIWNESLVDIDHIIREDFRAIKNKQNLLQELAKLKGVVDEILNPKNDKFKALAKETRPKLQEYLQELQKKMQALEQISNQVEKQTPEIAKADTKDDTEKFINKTENQRLDTTEVKAKKEDHELIAEQITESFVPEAQQSLLNVNFDKIFTEITYIKKAVDDFKKTQNDIVKIGSIEGMITSAFRNGVERISREVSQDFEDAKKAFAEHENNIQTFLRDEKTSRERFEEQQGKNVALQEELEAAKNEFAQLTNEIDKKNKTIEQLNTDKEKLAQNLADLDKENQRFQQLNKYRIKERFLVIIDIEKENETLKRFQSSLDRLLHLFSDYKESIDRLRQKVGLPTEIFRFNLSPFEALWECVQELETYGSVYKTELIRIKLNISQTEMSFKSFMEKLHDYSKKSVVVSNLDYFFVGLQKIYNMYKKNDMATNSDIDKDINALRGNDRLIREVVKEWVGLFPEPITLFDPFADHEKYCKHPPRVVSAKNYYPGVAIKPGTIIDILNWAYRDGEKWNTKAMVYISE